MQVLKYNIKIETKRQNELQMKNDLQPSKFYSYTLAYIPHSINFKTLRFSNFSSKRFLFLTQFINLPCKPFR